MAERKVIAVVGATGAQGSGLVRAITGERSGGFVVRALTRDATTDKANGMRKLGAEVVSANVDDGDSLRRAFDGAYGAFCVTFFWDHFSPERKLAQAKAMAQAAKDAGVKHVIWSTLEDTRRWVPLSDERMPTLMGKYKVPHLDAKGEADQIFKDLVPTTCLLTSFFWENFINFGAGPQKGPDGKLGITFPMGNKKLPGIASDDIGKCAYGIFKRGDEFIGKTVGIAGEHLTGSEMAAAMTRALGQEIRYNDIPPEVYRGLGFPGAEDLGNMFQFKRDFNDYFCGARSIEFSRSLNPSLQTFEQWLAENKGRIPLESATTAA
ncbi:MAG TPA: NmrA/HSCARG family protein [Terriglobales bacterium]|nr:NmrA/HSCARG family protein [Terriglobales bacterium]